MDDPSPATPLLRHRAFVRFLYVRIAASIALQMQAVAVGWQMYALTGSSFDLGLVGLMQFIPAVGLFLATGQAADRYDRRIVSAASQSVEAVGRRHAGACDRDRTAHSGAHPRHGLRSRRRARLRSSRACNRCCPTSCPHTCSARDRGVEFGVADRGRRRPGARRRSSSRSARVRRSPSARRFGFPPQPSCSGSSWSASFPSASRSI